jgi:hypothetical protein
MMLREELERSGLVKLVPVPSLPPIPMAVAARNFALLPDAAREFLVVYERLAREFGGAPTAEKRARKAVELGAERRPNARTAR